MEPRASPCLTWFWPIGGLELELAACSAGGSWTHWARAVTVSVLTSSLPTSACFNWCQPTRTDQRNVSSSLIRAGVMLNSDPYHRTTILLTTTTRCSVIFLSSFNSQFAAHNHNSQHQRHLCIIYGGMYYNLHGEVDLHLICSASSIL